ncbi:hypothetical protein GCM10011315_16520 [Roseovarius pacificus]|nr:hypothetical protein GCM10011315_16520 [Roseovarius pacificus]
MIEVMRWFSYPKPKSVRVEGFQVRKLALFIVCLSIQGSVAFAGALPEEIASMTCREFGEKVTAYTAEQTGPDAEADVILRTIRQSPMIEAVSSTMNDLDIEAHRRISPPFMERFINACPIVTSETVSDDVVTVGEAFDKAANSLELDPMAPRWGLMDAPDSLDYDTMTCMEIVEEARKIPGRSNNPVNDLMAAAVLRYLDEYDQSTPESLLKVRIATTSLAFMSAFEPDAPCKEVMDKAAAEAGLIRK